MANYRFRKTMLRVADLDRSVDFYTRMLGMTVIRGREFPAGKFTVAFVGYGDEATHPVIELTHNWDRTEPYELGEAFGLLGHRCARCLCRLRAA